MSTYHYSSTTMNRLKLFTKPKRNQKVQCIMGKRNEFQSHKAKTFPHTLLWECFALQNYFHAVSKTPRGDYAVV